MKSTAQALYSVLSTYLATPNGKTDATPPENLSSTQRNETETTKVKAEKELSMEKNVRGSDGETLKTPKTLVLTLSKEKENWGKERAGLLEQINGNGKNVVGWKKTVEYLKEYCIKLGDRIADAGVQEKILIRDEKHQGPNGHRDSCQRGV